MDLNLLKMNIKSNLLMTFMIIIVLIITNKLWLLPIPIEISLKPSCNGNFVLNAELTNSEWERYLQKSDLINKSDINNSGEVKLIVNNIQNPQKLRIKFSQLDSNKPITIRDVEIKGIDKEVLDLTKLDIEAGSIVKSDKFMLTIVPEGTMAILNYNDNLNIKSNKNINFKCLIVISLFSLFCFYLLFNYFHKNNELKIEIIFRIIFIVLLFIPMTNINKAEISEKENRTLAVFEPLIDKNNKINMHFFKGFNEWFDDRFFLKQQMCDIYTKIIFLISKNGYSNPGYFIDKHTNWMFNSQPPKLFYANRLLYTGKYIKRINKICQENNIKFYVLVIPYKEQVYNEFANVRYKQEYLNWGFLYEEMRNNTQIKIIYPYDKLLEAKKIDYVYYKSDHHLTDYGNYIAYQELVKEIQKDFPNFKDSGLNDFIIYKSDRVREEYDRNYTEGETFNNLNLNTKKVLDGKYIYLKYKNLQDMIILNDNYFKKRIFEYKDSKNNLKSIMIGNSMAESLSYIVAPDFQYMIKIRMNNGRKDKNNPNGLNMIEKELINLKPDIVIVIEGG